MESSLSFEIYDELGRYADSYDRRDWEALEDCFSEDAEATYGGAAYVGAREIVAAIRHDGEYFSTIHLLGASRISFDGPLARASTPAVAYLLDQVIDAAGHEWSTGRLRMRGLHYDDEFRRDRGRWRIRRRTHRVLWSVGLPAEVPVAPGGALWPDTE